MNQQQFKEAIFDERQEIKDKLANLYDSKKLITKLITVFKEIDYLTFCKLPQNEQRELVEKVFGSPELVFGKILRERIEKANKLADKRIRTKEGEE